jgi:hypothetical protein
MQAALVLLYVFLVAIVAALLITVLSVSAGIKVLALGAVTPLIVLTVVFIYFCGKRKAWSFLGASILGAVGAIFRVVVSTQPRLEVGGGLPVEVTVFYIVLGLSVSLVNFEAYLGTKRAPSPKKPKLESTSKSKINLKQFLNLTCLPIDLPNFTPNFSNKNGARLKKNNSCFSSVVVLSK